MGKVSISLALAIALVVVSARPGLAQSGYDAIAWQTLAEKLEAGVTVDVRLRDRQHFKATFIDARPGTLIVQRKTRIPIPVELIPYESIASMSRVEPSTLTAAKAAGIALGAAGAVITTFFVILLAYGD
jgi:hypothetical protein